jgi:hypothetical protein
MPRLAALHSELNELMDAAGNVYGAEVGPLRLMRYAKDK